MAILRTDIERGLADLASEEEGMRFQGLAVVLGKKRWPQLIAHQRKKDLGLDAYAPPSETPEKIGKGLAASLTPTLAKISADARTAKTSFPDLKTLLFVTLGKVGNTDRKRWEQQILTEHDLELLIIEREEIITQLMMPENAGLAACFLHVVIDSKPQIADLIDRTRTAATAVMSNWVGRTKGHPLIALTTVRLDPNGKESADILSLEQIDRALSHGRRVVLEGSAGRGKTTTLIQLAQRGRTAGIPFLVDLPAWTSSHRGILEHIAGMPPFLAEGLSAADLARVQQTEPFLLLLNGWNEIAESHSTEASDALKCLERDFPSAGIIIATRTHHLRPPLPGALRLRLLRLQPPQRAAYIDGRLGARGGGLRARIDADPSLDELTRIPFTLSEVISLFEADAEIPSTRIGVLTEVIRLQEQRGEHRNALEAAPVYGCQAEYLNALANEMTRRGAVALPEVDGRAIVAAVARELSSSGQIASVGPPTVLATLTAHHVLERVEYPQTGFRFEHQQLQEYFAGLDIHQQLLHLRDDDRETSDHFTAEYVNDPAWAEPLRMIAETLAEQSGDDGADTQNTRAGVRLVKMALAVDLVFAGELARLCGSVVWREVSVVVGERLRAVHAMGDGSYRQYALAAMLATGSDAFSDIIVRLLSEEDQQTRLSTYRLWPDIALSSLGGSRWRERVRGWSEEARSDFVSELLYHRIDQEVAHFAVEDKSIAVKMAAAESLMWSRAEDALTRVLESMDAQTFESFARQHAELMPAALKRRTRAAMRRFMETSADPAARLRTALDLVKFGENGLDDIIKDARAAMPRRNMRNLPLHNIQAALEHLRKRDSAWASKWVAIQTCEGALYDHENWLPFATSIPTDLVEKFLGRIESEDLKTKDLTGMIAVIAARADTRMAARVFAALRERRRHLDTASGQQSERQVMEQLEVVFCGLPDDIAVAGIMSSVRGGDAVDITVAARLLSRVARSHTERLRLPDDGLKARLRAYLKDSVRLVLEQDDFNGDGKADLASSIAQVGEPEDVDELMVLIRADIDRVRRGLAARAAGDRGPLGNGGSMSWAQWHLAAVMQLDRAGAEHVLIELLPVPEYRTAAAAAMMRDYVQKADRPFNTTIRYDLIWAARKGCTPASRDDQRRTRFAAALNAEIERLRHDSEDAKSLVDLRALGRALAAVDGPGSAQTVLDVIAKPGPFGQYTCLDAVERLLMAGVILPASAAFALVDAWSQNSDEGLLSRMLALCLFVDDPAAGIAKVRDALRQRRFWGRELRELVTALGECRADAAVDLLYEMASDAQTFGSCEDALINAIAAFDVPQARELLVGLVDPDIHGIALPTGLRREDVLVARLTELARRSPTVCGRLRELCERDLPDLNRRVISRVMDGIGTPGALSANLTLIDDASPSPVPVGVWHQLEAAFVGRRYLGDCDAFTEHARASNELRERLFRMGSQDSRRRRSACMLLGKIEEWRLEHGRPTGEPRHPDLTSDGTWPPAPR